MQICSPRLGLRVVWLKLTAGRYFLEKRLVYEDTQFKSAKYFNLERKEIAGKMKEHFSFAETTTVHFTDACLVAKPLNRSEAKGDIFASFYI